MSPLFLSYLATSALLCQFQPAGTFEFVDSGQRAGDSSRSEGITRAGDELAAESEEPGAQALPDGFRFGDRRVIRTANFRQEGAMPPGWSYRGGIDHAIGEVLFDSRLLISPEGEPAWLTPQVLIRWRKGCHTDQQRDALSRIECEHDLHHYRNLPGLSLLRLSVGTGEEVLQVIEAIKAHEAIDFVEADLMVRGRSASAFIDDPLFADSWHLQNTGQDGGLTGFDLNALGAWKFTTGGTDHAVLVIDVGVDESHPDLLLSEGRDFTTGEIDGIPGGDIGNTCDRHGTPVAGCVASIRDNGLGTLGIASGSRTLSARTFVSNLNCSGSWNTQWSWTVNALNWGVEQGVRVTNNSNFYGSSPSSIASAYEITRLNGMVHFASAGNSNIEGESYPASLPTVEGIGAADRYGDRSVFSNYGSEVILFGPGSQILAADISGSGGYDGSDYASISGTSFAAPLVAAVASLMLDVAPDLTPDEITEILRDTCRDMAEPGQDLETGLGLVDAGAAVESAFILGCPSNPDCDSGSECPEDLTDDGQVDGSDLSTVLGFWGCTREECPGDLNSDGTVDGTDLAIILSAWGVCDG